MAQRWGDVEDSTNGSTVGSEGQAHWLAEAELQEFRAQKQRSQD